MRLIPEIWTKYIIERRDDKFVIYSVVPTGFGGVAKNYVAERDTEANAKKLVERLLLEFTPQPPNKAL